MNKKVAYKILFLFSLFIQQALLAQKQVKPVPPLSSERGKLVYSNDELGNRIPDFSYCGYKASEQSIPNLDVKVVVPVKSGDATFQYAYDNKGNWIKRIGKYEKGTFTVVREIIY